MKKYLGFLLFFFALAPYIAPAQGCEGLVKDARKLAQNLKFDEAVKKVEAAKGCASQAEIDRLYSEIFAGLKKQTADANKAKERAEKAEKDAVKAKDEAVEAKNNAETEKQNAIKQKLRAENAEQQSIEVLNKIYFYQDRFGLAYDKGRYGYIDKKLNNIIPFKYEYASSFNLNGFAKVVKNNQHYMIDTQGNEYRLANFIHEVNDSTEAIDFSNQNLLEVPNEVNNCTNLKILILYNNKIKAISSSVVKNAHLFYLDISNNRIAEFPEEISFNNDIILNILGNPINYSLSKGIVKNKAEILSSIKVYDTYAELQDRIKADTSTYVLFFWATYDIHSANTFAILDSLSTNTKFQKVKILLVSVDFKQQIETRLLPFLVKHQPIPEVVLLADYDADSWVPLVSDSWDGGIPFTAIFKPNGEVKAYNGKFSSKKEFIEFYNSK